MSISDRDFICTRPFEWFEIHPRGQVFLCCPSWLTRPIGNLLEQTPEEIWHGPIAREIRKSILNGSFHNCKRKRCPFLANRISPVRRLIDIDEEEPRSALTKPELPPGSLPEKLNLCFDLSCNLSCPSCRPHPQMATGRDLEQSMAIAAIVKNKLLSHAREITMSGFGDPFGSPVYFDILKHLNNRPGNSPSLRLHSNGQLWTAELWATLPGLHERVTAVEISVDAGSAATYSLNRPGGSFAKLLDNLAFLAAQPFQLTLSMVVQQNNARDIPLLCELAAQLGARLYLSQLVNWGTFSREEFQRRAIHLPQHPDHRQLVSILASVARQPHVDPGNLISVLESQPAPKCP